MLVALTPVSLVLCLYDGVRKSGCPHRYVAFVGAAACARMQWQRNQCDSAGVWFPKDL